MNGDYSRAELLATGTTAISGDLLAHLERQTVIVSCDPDPAMVRSARILLTTLRRLPIILGFDGAALSAKVVDDIDLAVRAVDPEKPLQPVTSGVRIHIGLTAPAGTIRVVPTRHGVRVVHDDRAMTTAPASALGCAMAASAAAAEVFKIVVQVREDRRSDGSYAFCPVTLSDRPELAPPIDEPLEVSGALVGLGAIGTAIAMILGDLNARGSLDLVDRQRYAKENVTTYSLGGLPDADAGVWKTELAARVLTSIKCVPYNDGIDEYLAAVQRGEIRAPRLILAGLDNIDARHATQRLWPDLLIDGATGDTMLGLHVVHDAGQPCIECFLPKPTGGPSPYERLSALTGLSIEKLRNGDEVLTLEDLKTLGDEQRARIASHVGKKICGLADAVGLTDLDAEGFRPSAAFVSLAAGCLVVGRFIAVELGIEPAENFVQYDALFGPRAAIVERRRAMPSCYCVDRAPTITRVRASRFQTSHVELPQALAARYQAHTDVTPDAEDDRCLDADT
jgi:hypothetical protein